MSADSASVLVWREELGALGARLQGSNIAVMTYIGDGGQSTGVTYEGLNFAAVQPRKEFIEIAFCHIFQTEA